MQNTDDEQTAFFDLFDKMSDDWVEVEEPKEDITLHDAVDVFIIDSIAEALKESAGNRTHAAKKLGISRECLIYKIKKYF